MSVCVRERESVNECVCERVCVCVCERERERKVETHLKYQPAAHSE